MDHTWISLEVSLLLLTACPDPERAQEAIRMVVVAKTWGDCHDRLLFSLSVLFFIDLWIFRFLSWYKNVFLELFSISH